MLLELGLAGGQNLLAPTRTAASAPALKKAKRAPRRATSEEDYAAVRAAAPLRRSSRRREPVRRIRRSSMLPSHLPQSPQTAVAEDGAAMAVDEAQPASPLPQVPAIGEACDNIARGLTERDRVGFASMAHLLASPHCQLFAGHRCAGCHPDFTCLTFTLFSI